MAKERLHDAGDEAVAAAPAADEAQRLQALLALEVLDTLPEPVFDAITAAASQICGVPIALISLVDAERQWFKSNVGLPGVDQTPREVAFCDHAIRDDALLEVPDATRDARFAANPLVTGQPDIRFYAGAPIVLDGGARVGTVCVIDRAPRRLDTAQRTALLSLSGVAAACLNERRRLLDTAARLAASEASYRAIVEDQSELISLARPDGTLTFVNGAYARHFGRQPAQMVGHDLLEFVDAADRDAVRSHLASVCASHGSASGVNRMISAEGRTRWVAWSNRALRDDHGRATAIQSVGRDITEQRLAEQALAESEQRYRRLYEATPAMLHSIDAQGRLLQVSDRWLEVLGYRRDEVIGRLSSDFLDPESQRRAREEVLPRFFRTGTIDRVEYRFVRRDGALLDIVLSAVLERDAGGAPQRSLAVLEDITEHKRVAAHLDAIVDHVPAMLGYWDGGAVTRFANREFQAALGLPLNQILGYALPEIYRQVDAEGYRESLAPAVAGVLRGQAQDFECALLTATGLRQLRIALVPNRSGGGFYGLWHDITGRKALELRLTDSELRYRSLFENLNSGFALHEIVVDAQGRPVNFRYLAMNAAFTEMTGVEPGRAIGRLVTEVLPGIEADPADWIGTYGRVAQTGVPVHFEQRAALLDRWYQVVAYRPAPGQFAVIVQDVTQRKATEAELALGEQRLRLLVDAVHEHSMILLDAAGRIETWNAGAQRIMGYVADEIVGRDYACFFGAEDRAAGLPQTLLARALERGQWASEGWRWRRDGSRFWAAASVTAVRDAQGALRGYVKITHDLTERRRQHDLLQRVAQLAPSAMLVYDGAERVVYANGEAVELFGYPHDELIGSAHARLIAEPLGAASAAGSDVHATRKDGSGFDAELRVTTFETPDGPLSLAAVVDVTERRRQRERLESAVREKETLLREVYHRVKNNLQVVESLLSLQQRSVEPGAAQHAFADCVQRVRAMALVHEKLYQSGDLSAVSLADYTQELLRQIAEATAASTRRIALRAEIAPLSTGLDDAIPFGLLVAELVGNALKHGYAGRAGGTVRVTLVRGPQGAELAVADDGAGLPAGFELAAVRSMGLQLAVTLAGQLGGELTARNDGGARFGALLTRL